MIAIFVLAGGLIFCFVSGYWIGCDLTRQERLDELKRKEEEARRKRGY